MLSLRERLVRKVFRSMSVKDAFKFDYQGGGRGGDNSTYEYTLMDGSVVELEGSVNAINALETGDYFIGKVTKKQLLEYVANYRGKDDCHTEKNCGKSELVKKLKVWQILEPSYDGVKHHVIINNGNRCYKAFKEVKFCVCEELENLK